MIAGCPVGIHSGIHGVENERVLCWWWCCAVESKLVLRGSVFCVLFFCAHSVRCCCSVSSTVSPFLSAAHCQPAQLLPVRHGQRLTSLVVGPTKRTDGRLNGRVGTIQHGDIQLERGGAQELNRPRAGKRAVRHSARHLRLCGRSRWSEQSPSLKCTTWMRLPPDALARYCAPRARQ
jgi:hypothetical protein